MNSIRRYLLTGEYVNALGANPAQKLVYMQDQIGSVRDIVDADTGARVGAFDYTPYGTTTRQSSTANTSYRYGGLFWDGNIGQYLSVTRQYDPGTLRWLNRDFIREEGGINMFAYAKNPISQIDPMGHNPLLLAAFAGAAVEVTGSAFALGNAAIAAGGGLTAGGIAGLVSNVTRIARGSAPPASSFSGSQRAPLQCPAGLAPRNSAGEFNGRTYSGHAFDQMQNRGIPPSVVDQALSTGIETPGKLPQTIVKYDAINNLRVVVDGPSGNVITVIPGK